NKPNHIDACAIIKSNNKFFLEKRADSNRWALMGGGLKIDESLEEGIIKIFYLPRSRKIKYC
ncbi:NUDIX hydrolase, partial [Clostridium sp. UBA7503]|uniref:NUDIX hydrolase n=1 Tax=Clostridium sp. UBA7503 TaxID=1946377 RepID=UPI0039C87D99